MLDVALANDAADTNLRFENPNFVDTLEFGFLVICTLTLEQNLATPTQNVTNMNFLFNQLVQVMILGIPNVAPMDGDTHTTSPLGNTSQGINALHAPTTQETTNMINNMKCPMHKWEEHNHNNDAANIFFAKVESHACFVMYIG